MHWMCAMMLRQRTISPSPDQSFGLAGNSGKRLLVSALHPWQEVPDQPGPSM
jgi:hypothetical protein